MAGENGAVDSILVPTPPTPVGIDHVWTTVLTVVMASTPLSILIVLATVLCSALLRLQQNTNVRLRVTQEDSILTSPQFVPDTQPSTNDLPKLLADVADALDDANVTYWLLPGLGLLPPSTQNSNAIGKLNPWQEGVDIGVHQHDLLAVISAQAELQRTGIVPVESYFGLRLYPLSGREDNRYDFRAPFLDILYFKEANRDIVNSCCDCAPITISSCTKKTCGCLICAAEAANIFPLTSINIENVRRKIAAPRNLEGMLLHHDIDDVHPLVFDV